jgi:hypothetical protein
MKLTKSKLKKIIKEVLNDLEEIEMPQGLQDKLPDTGHGTGAPAGWRKADWDAKHYNAGYEDALDGKEPDLKLSKQNKEYYRGYRAGLAS